MTETGKSRLSSVSMRLAPWIVSVLIFFYIFKKYSPSQLLSSLRYVHFPFFIGYVLAYFLLSWLLDCWSLSKLLNRFGLRVSLSEILPLRMATYLVMILNYGAASGLFALFLKKKRIPVFKSGGLMAFVMMIDFYLTFSLAFTGSFLTDVRLNGVLLNPTVRWLWAAATAVIVTLIILSKLSKREAEHPLIRRLRSFDLLHVFHDAGWKDYATGMLLRSPIHVMVSTSLFFIAMTYGVHLPFFSVISNLPLIILIGVIPITPGGLGTVQLATVELFRDHLTGPIIDQGVPASEILLSMSLLSLLANYTLKAIVGSFFLGRISNSRGA